MHARYSAVVRRMARICELSRAEAKVAMSQDTITQGRRQAPVHQNLRSHPWKGKGSLQRNANHKIRLVFPRMQPHEGRDIHERIGPLSVFHHNGEGETDKGAQRTAPHRRAQDHEPAMVDHWHGKTALNVPSSFILRLQASTYPTPKERHVRDRTGQLQPSTKRTCGSALQRESRARDGNDIDGPKTKRKEHEHDHRVQEPQAPHSSHMPHSVLGL